MTAEERATALLRAELEAAISAIAARWEGRFAVEVATVTLASVPASPGSSPAPSPPAPLRVSLRGEAL